MQIEIVDTIERRLIYPVPGENGEIVDLVPGRTSFAFVLKMADGKRVVAEVSEDAFENFMAAMI